MNRQLPNDYPYPPLNHGIGRGSNRVRPFSATDENSNALFYCDLNSVTVLPPRESWSSETVPNHPSLLSSPGSNQPRILHALLTAPPYPQPAISDFMISSPSGSSLYTGSGPSTMTFYSDTSFNISEHENDAPPGKRPKLSFSRSRTPSPRTSETRSLSSTPELFIDESVREVEQSEETDAGHIDKGVEQSPQAEGYRQEFESITPPNEPASSPPPMVVTSHKKFHYKTWAAGNGNTRSIPNQQNSSGVKHGQPSDMKPYGAVNSLNLSPYITEAQALGRLRALGAQEAQREIDSFSAIITTGAMFRMGQKEKARAKHNAAVQEQQQLQSSILNNYRPNGLEVINEAENANSNDSTETMDDLFRDVEHSVEPEENSQDAPIGEVEGAAGVDGSSTESGSTGEIDVEKEYGGKVHMNALAELMDCVTEMNY